MRASAQVRLRNAPRGEYVCSYQTHKAGEHKTLVNFDELLLPQCPLAFHVLPGRDPTLVSARGDGLMNGFAREQRSFDVLFNGAYVEKLEVEIEGPTRDTHAIQVRRDEQAATYAYTPPSAGSYKIGIRVNGLDIEGSPFPVLLEDKFYLERVRLDPINNSELRVGQPCRLLADLSESGRAPFAAYAQSGSELEPDYDVPLDVRPVDEEGLMFQVLYTPTEPGILRCIALLGGQYTVFIIN